MSQDKELEIRLQFLDEAQEYLSPLEEALLGISSNGIDIQAINGALRAAHSIKGGAGMMGYQVLSHYAHRLEDSLKVLKVQKHSVAVDAELEGLLLAGVDCLRQVVESVRHTSLEGQDPNSPEAQQWIAAQAEPIFDNLYERLGEPQAEDANSILSPEDGQDIIPLLFQTEVEGCLERLESVITSNAPCLREEVEILAQELGGLGEMLQLPSFTQLCESILQHITATDRVPDVAQLALQAWRRSQALVLTGNLDALPNAIEGVSLASPNHQAVSSDPSEQFVEPIWVDQNVTEPFFDTNFDTNTEVAWTDQDILANVLASDPATDSATLIEPDTLTAHSVEVESVNSLIAPDQATDELLTSASSTAEISSEMSVVKAIQPSIQSEQSVRGVQPTELRVTEIKPEPSSTTKDSQENTVRVPIKHLDQLNDLFGELTIERNGLDLHLKRLRNLVQLLNERVQTLEHSNVQLRDSYDKVATHAPIHPLSQLLLPAATSPEIPDNTEHTNGFVGLNNKFDVLEMDQYNDLHLLSQEVMETIVQIQEVSSDIELGLDDTEQTARELYKTSRQLRTKLTQVRMRPLSDILDRFPRAIREMSLQYDKPVELKLHGGNTLVDRNILEALSDPLMHLIRNAFDHGVEDIETRRMREKSEQGLIEIRAIHRNNRTIITVRDDGGGIPLDKIRAKARQMGLDEMLLAAASDEEILSLIFEPGFSTSEKVTALSGRGVGMDVVRDRLKQIQGEIKVDTEAGVGTTFTLSVPFTLSVTRALIAESNGMLLAFPIDAIEEMIVVPSEEIVPTAGTEAFNWQGSMVQFIRLSKWLKFYCPRQLEGLETQASIGVPTVLLFSQSSDVIGLQIDRSWGEQEVTIRKVEGGLPMPPGFTNCTILGDGRVVPMVNVPELLRWIASCERVKEEPEEAPRRTLLPSLINLKSPPPTVYPDRQPTVLVIDDSINVRRLLALTLEKAGYQVAQAKDGQDALDKLSAGLNVQAVICDIEMPRLDGYGFLARIKSSPELERIPVAMLTSRSGDKHRQLAISLGATAYFSKPYNEQMLLQTLEKW
ncbi:MAG: response regulator [Cyanobacteria bacterium CRU_2_1]|nr:response regulator [Cyanobacteria bacterium RU_5_0]NJR61657.1 response regulator [Cyanobacteria bacterium CRU_2_1]